MGAFLGMARINKNKSWVRNIKDWKEKMVSKGYKLEKGWEYGRLGSYTPPSDLTLERRILRLEDKVDALSDKVNMLVNYMFDKKAEDI